MNKFTLIGRIASVHNRVSSKGVKSIQFQVITEEDNPNGGDKITSSFFCTMFGKRAEALIKVEEDAYFATYNALVQAGQPQQVAIVHAQNAAQKAAIFKKGHLVSVNGTVRSNTYEKDGQTVRSYDFIIDPTRQGLKIECRTFDEMLESRQKYESQSDVTHVGTNVEFPQGVVVPEQPVSPVVTQASMPTQTPVQPMAPVVSASDDEPF